MLKYIIFLILPLILTFYGFIRSFQKLSFEFWHGRDNNVYNSKNTSTHALKSIKRLKRSTNVPAKGIGKRQPFKRNILLKTKSNQEIRLSFVSAKLNFSLANNVNIISDPSSWYSHFYIFVGGDHNSGTSFLERLISTQTYSSGLRVEGQVTSRPNSCRKQLYLHHARQRDLSLHLIYLCNSCHYLIAFYSQAPENEGVFVTKAFSKWYKKKGRTCTIKNGQYGTCAASNHMTERDLMDPIMNVKDFRNEILLDWKEFHFNPKALYYVEKDIQSGPFRS